MSLLGWSRRIGVHENTIRARLGNGASIEEALAPAKPRGRRAARIEYGGEALTLKEWAERTGVSYHTLKHRLHLGWSVERALGVPARPTPGRIPQLLEHNGEKLTVAEWSQRLGIHEESLRNRLNMRGWPPEIALTTGNIQGRSHLNQAA